MFSTDFIFRQQENLVDNQKCQAGFRTFGWLFYTKVRLKYEKDILLSSSRAFSLSTPTFLLSTPVDNRAVRLHGKSLQNATKPKFVSIFFSSNIIDLVKNLHSLQIPCRQFCMPIWFPSLLASTTAISLEDVLWEYQVAIHSLSR